MTARLCDGGASIRGSIRAGSRESGRQSSGPHSVPVQPVHSLQTHVRTLDLQFIYLFVIVTVTVTVMSVCIFMI